MVHPTGRSALTWGGIACHVAVVVAVTALYLSCSGPGDLVLAPAHAGAGPCRRSACRGRPALTPRPHFCLAFAVPPGAYPPIAAAHEFRTWSRASAPADAMTKTG